MIQHLNFEQKNAITPEATSNGVETDADKSPDLKDPKESLTTLSKLDDEKKDVQSICLEAGDKVTGKKAEIQFRERTKTFHVYKSCANTENCFDDFCRQ